VDFTACLTQPLHLKGLQLATDFMTSFALPLDKLGCSCNPSHSEPENHDAWRDLLDQWKDKLQARLEEDLMMIQDIQQTIPESSVVSHKRCPSTEFSAGRSCLDPDAVPIPPRVHSQGVLLGFTSLTGDNLDSESRSPVNKSASETKGHVKLQLPTDHAESGRDHRLYQIHSIRSAPASFVYFNGAERKRLVMQRSEYLESNMGPSDVQHHEFQPLVTWTRGEDPGFRISGADAKLPSSDFAEDLMVVQEYNGFFRHFMIFPSSPLKLAWDCAGAGLIVHDLFTISMQVFEPPETDISNFMQWLILTYWSINMLISCLVGYIDKGIFDIDKGIFVMVPHKVIFHYIKTWFLIDMIVVGSDWIFSLSASSDGSSESSAGSSVKLLRSLRLFRMVRLVRILRLRKTMESISDLVDSEYISIVVSILKMLALLLIVNHVIACVWFWIGDLHGGGGWIEAHQLNDAAWDYQYATSLHWAITQFTPASMHVQPHNMSERMFAIGTVVFALVGFSYVVGSISGSLAQLRGMTENRARQFWELRRHLRKNHVSITLSARIQKYAEHVLESQEDNVPAKDVKLLSLLSEQLRSELECEICMPHFSVHPLFARLCVVSRVTIHRLANNAIYNKLLARTDTLFIPGETATHMYIVVAGRLVYSRFDSKNDEHKELVDKGEDWISEPVLWTSTWVHLGLLTALTECALMVLDPVQFGRIVNLNPDANMLATTYVKNFIAWINSVERDSLSDIWQGENVSPRVASFMELDENQFRNAKSLAAKLMNWQV